MIIVYLRMVPAGHVTDLRENVSLVDNLLLIASLY